MEEPLGSRCFVRHLKSFFNLLLLAILLATPGWADPPSRSCASHLLNIIDTSIEKIALSRPESTDQVRTLLRKMRSKLEQRVLAKCPEPASCSQHQLAEVVAIETHEVLDEYLPKPSRWRIYAIFGGALAGQVALSTAVQHYTNDLTATALSTFLTIVGALALNSIGAPVLEPIFAIARRMAYASGSDRGAESRGPATQRQQRIYRLTQELVSSIEEMGRYTDRKVKSHVVTTLNGLNPQLGEEHLRFLGRSSYLMARLLSDIVPNYGDLDFSESDYAGYVQLQFSHWFIDDSTRDSFREATLELITEFDSDSKQGNARWEEYDSILRSWLAPRPDFSARPDSR